MRMNLHLNGELFDAPENSTIAELVSSIEISAKRYAVEVNETIIPRSKHDSYALSEGDNVEIVVAIGGG